MKWMLKGLRTVVMRQWNGKRSVKLCWGRWEYEGKSARCCGWKECRIFEGESRECQMVRERVPHVNGENVRL